MSKRMWWAGTTLILAMAVLAATGLRPAGAAPPQGIDPDVQAALSALYQKVPQSRNLGAQAKGILVFPKIVKAGFIVGAQYGEGELLKRGQVAGYYNMAAASYGLQAGVQGSEITKINP